MLAPFSIQLEKYSVILASKSPRRSELLSNLGIRFEVIPSTFDEDLDKKSFAVASGYVAATAREKALDVFRRSADDTSKPKLIISADTIVVLGDKILEKPADADDAFKVLSSLSGNTHSVYTSVTLVKKDLDSGEMQISSFTEETKVTFSTLDSKMISAYIATGEPMDKAGSYGIQALGGSFVEKVEGCYFSVVGFPQNRFCRELIKFLNL